MLRRAEVPVHGAVVGDGQAGTPGEDVLGFRDLSDLSPPGTAEALRRQLPGNAAPVPVIETVGRGYRIPIGPGQLDALVFAERAARSRDLTGQGRAGEAAELMRSALGLWRGPALAAITGRVVRAGAARLDEQRLALTEDYQVTTVLRGLHTRVLADHVEA